MNRTDELQKGCGKKLSQYPFVESKDKCCEKELCYGCQRELKGRQDAINEVREWLISKSVDGHTYIGTPIYRINLKMFNEQFKVNKQ
jgi:hypothetical protein